MSIAKLTTTPIDWESRYQDLWRTALEVHQHLIGLREVARLAADPNVETRIEHDAIFDLFDRALDDAITALDYVPKDAAP
jgi:hypothetical protein